MSAEELAQVTCRDVSSGQDLTFTLRDGGWSSSGADAGALADALNALFGPDRYAGPAHGTPGGAAAARAARWLAGFNTLRDVRVTLPPQGPYDPAKDY